MKKFRAFSVAILATIMAVACGEENYNIGSSYLNDSHQMSSGSITFSVNDDAGAEKALTARHYRTTRINAATQGVGLFGEEYSAKYGRRKSSVFAQYVPLFSVDEDDEFGYLPIVDSVMFYPTLAYYSGDTTQTYTYEVYEVLDNSFIVNSTDSIFFPSDFVETINGSGVLGEKLFEFTFPNQAKEVYTTSTYVRCDDVTVRCRELLDVLMLQGEGDDEYDYSLYDYDEDAFETFASIFKGIYIIPKENQVVSEGGATYSLDLSSSGWGFFARNVYEDAPEIIKDTVGMTYIFNDSYSDAGYVSINAVDFDYSGSYVEGKIKVDDETGIDSSGDIRIEGMGGLINEITLEKEFFERFNAILEEAGDNYANVFFNTARMTLYVDDVEAYGSYDISYSSIAKLSMMPSRIGLYTDYTNYSYDDLTTVVDYDYYTEYTYSTMSSYDGSINRGQACYVMNIPNQLQEIWGEYSDLSASEREMSQEDWDALDWNKLYIAPIIGDSFTPRYTTLQGENDGVNKAPLKLAITYTLLKK